MCKCAAAIALGRELEIRSCVSPKASAFRGVRRRFDILARDDA